MKYLLFLIAGFSLVSMKAEQQKKKKGFLPGHVVTLEGDTLKGMVKKTKFKDLREIYFIDDKNVEYTYTADSLNGFLVGPEKYIVVNSDSLGYSEHIDDNKRLFLLEMFTGPISFYQYEFCFKKDNYSRKWTDTKSSKVECRTYQYMKKGSDPYVIGSVKAPLGASIGIKNKPVDSFKLAAYFDEYEDLSKKFLYKIYKESHLIPAIQEYNKWYTENN